MGVILAWFRVSEVFMGLIAAVIADIVFAPRSGRKNIECLKKDICIYRDKLYVHGVDTEIVENVERLATLLTKYKRVLIVE